MPDEITVISGLGRFRRDFMSDIETIGIGELAPPRPLAEALTWWYGFAELAPASFSKPAMPCLVLPNSPDAKWRWDQVPEQRLRALGCSFIRDLEVSGSGYMFHGGRFVREYVNISDVALRWLNQPDFYDNPLTRPRTNRVVIEEPALMVFGPGSSVYGHWLLDFMPRIVIAQQLLGAALDEFVLPLPSDSPDWVVRMLHTFCGIQASQVRYYSRSDDVVICRRACVPSYAHSGKAGDYAPHPIMRAFYDRFGDRGAPRAKRRICLSRREQERHTLGVWRIFEQREAMEEMAAARGFEIVRPETLGFPEQVELFRSAECILGENGSGMHAAVFADPDTIIATVGAWNLHQLNISAAFHQRSICLMRHQVLQDWDQPPFRFSVADGDLTGLFALIDATRDSAPLGFGRFDPAP